MFSTSQWRIQKLALGEGQIIFDTRGVHKVSFPLVPQLLNHLLREATACTSHDACNSRTSHVLTIASLQRLKMEALIPTPADREVWSAIKVFEIKEHSADLNPSSAVSGLWPHTTRQSTHLLQEFSWQVVNHHPPYSSDLAPNDFHLFFDTSEISVRSASVFSKWQREGDECRGGSKPSGSLLRHRIQKLIPRCDKCLNSECEYVEKYLNTCCICSNKSFH